MLLDKRLSLCDLYYVCLLFSERQTYMNCDILALTDVKSILNYICMSLFRNHVAKGNSLFPLEKHFVSASETKCFASRNM